MKNEEISSYNNWKSLLLKCQQCKLHKTRIQVVIGDGELSSPIILVGEAPGADEDKQGIPFIGRSGKLLRKSLTELELINHVYITNIVKCRPPNNRDPERDELNACGYYLINQIKDYIKPKIIVGIGRISSELLYGKHYIQKYHHGKIFERGKYLFMGTYHPAAALRNSDWKNKMIADLTLLKKFIS